MPCCSKTRSKLPGLGRAPRAEEGNALGGATEQQGGASAPRVFAITGSMGSGKSTVSRVVAAAGVPVVDADQVARAVVERGTPGLAEIIDAFGTGCLDEAGALDRKALGRVVFSDAAQRERLNAIVHPRVRDEVARRVAEYGRAGAELVAYDIPLLFETGQQARFRPVVVVVAPEAECIERVMARDGLSRSDAQQRWESQVPLEQKRRLADVVIENSGGLEELKARTRKALDEVHAWVG